jgi:hypothetical protein
MVPFEPIMMMTWDDVDVCESHLACDPFSVPPFPTTTICEGCNPPPVL